MCSKHVVFGRVIDGLDVVRAMEKLQTGQEDRPFQDVRVSEGGRSRKRWATEALLARMRGVCVCVCVCVCVSHVHEVLHAPACTCTCRCHSSCDS